MFGRSTPRILPDYDIIIDGSREVPSDLANAANGVTIYKNGVLLKSGETTVLMKDGTITMLGNVSIKSDKDVQITGLTR